MNAVGGSCVEGGDFRRSGVMPEDGSAISTVDEVDNE